MTRKLYDPHIIFSQCQNCIGTQGEAQVALRFSEHAHRYQK